ncbi:hypothetical protein ACMD2_15344 [Ananas comosus]|uniref:Endonuclease/exonuclease/phosphatase domain-containing protein n=1 Tax=Ananas comosus TaxID=4615 RepID=A0A199VPP3_ANACO|nr:hypothetical protein ACMD2_15344 [Ananas comosus]
MAAHLKADFFQELRSIKDFSTRVWTMLGDFNVLLSVEDKIGSTANVADILNFREVVHDLGLVDLPILNKSFTWTNGRGAPTLERLDRAFISSNWLLAFPRSTLRALPRPNSDHTPLVLSAYRYIPQPCDLEAQQANRCLLWIAWLDKAEEGRILTNLERSLRPRLKEHQLHFPTLERLLHVFLAPWPRWVFDVILPAILEPPKKRYYGNQQQLTLPYPEEKRDFTS